MNLKSITLALMLVIASTVQIAHAESVVDKAVRFASTLRDEAASSVQIALDRVDSAQMDLRIAQAVSRDAVQANDRTAISVASGAIGEAKLGLLEAEQLLKRARASLSERERTLQEIGIEIKGKRIAGVLIVPIEGTVRVLKHDGSHGAAQPGTGMAGERIETGPNSRVRLFVAAGESEIDLRENSSFIIVKNDSITGFSGDLEKGFLRIRVLTKKFSKKFEVRTPSTATTVRGTEFSVKVLDDGDLIRVYKGVVQVTSLSGDEAMDVQAGTQLRHNKDRGFMQVEPIDSADQNGWRENASDQ